MALSTIVMLAPGMIQATSRSRMGNRATGSDASVILRVVILTMTGEIAAAREQPRTLKTKYSAAAGPHNGRVEIDQSRVVGRGAALNAVRPMTGGAGSIHSPHMFVVLLETPILENTVVDVVTLVA